MKALCEPINIQMQLCIIHNLSKTFFYLFVSFWRSQFSFHLLFAVNHTVLRSGLQHYSAVAAISIDSVFHPHVLLCDARIKRNFAFTNISVSRFDKIQKGQYWVSRCEVRKWPGNGGRDSASCLGFLLIYSSWFWGSRMLACRPYWPRELTFWVNLSGWSPSSPCVKHLGSEGYKKGNSVLL